MKPDGKALNYVQNKVQEIEWSLQQFEEEISGKVKAAKSKPMRRKKVEVKPMRRELSKLRYAIEGFELIHF